MEKTRDAAGRQISVVINTLNYRAPVFISGSWLEMEAFPACRDHLLSDLLWIAHHRQHCLRILHRVVWLSALSPVGWTGGRWCVIGARGF